MQNIDDDHLLYLFGEDDKMLASPGETQVFGQIGINQPPAIMRHRGPSCDLTAGSNQVLLVGRGLT